MLTDPEQAPGSLLPLPSGRKACLVPHGFFPLRLAAGGFGKGTGGGAGCPWSGWWLPSWGGAWPSTNG
ncbi:MAG: hypothetical protein GX442_00500 [Candidatus Riflebacteria bacterium]|nr:hypothetical protein [Candidatus Riflebacteria bacterium]